MYNDKELFDDADLNWYDYGFRNYDPQIGRFTQLDPLTYDYPSLTPYQYASDDPITNVDIDGLEGGSSVFGYINGAVVTEGSFMSEFIVGLHLILLLLARMLKNGMTIFSKGASITGKVASTANLTNMVLNRNASESTCIGCGKERTGNES